jgi:hypothetical protein
MARAWRVRVRGSAPLAGAVAALIAVMLALPARAASPAVTVALAPGDLTLRPGTSAQVALILRNDADLPVTGLTLDALPPDGVKVDDLPKAPVDIAAHAGSSQTLSLDLLDFSSGGALVLRATYHVGDGTEAATGAVTVHAESGTASVDSLVAVEVHSTSGTVDENTDTSMALLIHNKGPVALYVSAVDADTSSKPLKITTENRHAGLTVQPLDTAVLTYTAKVDGRTRAGKQMVTFTVHASMPPMLPDAVRVVATQPVEVQVFGESALLAATSVPSLLVLPGFLLVASLGYLARQLSPRIAAHIPDPTGPYFWLLAVAASLAAMPLYRLASGRWFFVDAYNFTDIVVLWVVSIAAGLLVFLIWWAADDLYRRRREPVQGDGAAALLRKIARTGGRSTGLRYGQVAGMPGNVAELPFNDVNGDATKRWVAPRIAVEVPAADAPGLTQAIDAQNTNRQADLVDGRPTASVRWALPGRWPMAVDQAAVASLTEETALVQVQVQ